MSSFLADGTAAWICGAPVFGDDRITLVNPADLSATTECAVVTDPTTVRRAVQTAVGVQEAWGRTSPRVLSDVLTQMADRLHAAGPVIAESITREMGKLLAESYREVDLGARVFRYAAQHVLRSRGHVYRSNSAPDTLLYTRSIPVGPTAVITPWNFPVGIASWKIASALALGNTVVWKPSEVVPSTSLLVMEALAGANLPPEVLSLVIGTGPQVGSALVTDPDIQAITFTGSTAAGRAIQASAPATRTQLEMGGKNSTTVWNDVDLETAAARVTESAFGGAGQRCTATSRVLVHTDVISDFVEILAARTASIVVGPPSRTTTTMGPVATAAQLTKTVHLVDNAVGAGARTQAGGHAAIVDGPEGLYFEPTLLCDVPRGAALHTQEVFAPILEVIGVSNLDEAVARTNETTYGLSASIFTTRLDVALSFVDRVRAGVVKVNQITSGNEMHVPFGGLKDSGSGPPEQGESIDDFFASHSTVSIAGLLR